MRHLVPVFALLFVVCGATTIATAAALEPRVALVIGNGAYPNAPLANPVNDARLMAETLRGLGFDVIERTDATQREMKLAIFELGDRLGAAGKDAVGLFYYAGHGVQVDGENYLIPLNAEITRERHVAIEAVGANWVLGQMEFAQNRVNFVILDACRNNPLTRGFRSQLRGLAKMNAPTGSLVAYSTGPGDVAVDGDGANSPYTLALSRVMQMPGLPAEKVFKLVRDAVREATNDEQTPWEESSMTGADFYFNVNPSVTVGATEPTTPSAIDTAAMTQQETVFWESIEDSAAAADYQAYLSQYPDGAFATLAKLRLSTFGQAATETESKAAEAQALAQQQAQERALWDTIKNSNRAVDYQVYLQQFPNGTYAVLARARLAEAERKAAEEAARQEAERKAQAERDRQKDVQTALLVPPEQTITIRPEELLNNEIIKERIIEFYDDARTDKKSYYKLTGFVTLMETILDLKVVDVSGRIAKIMVSYRWAYDMLWNNDPGGNDHGIATIEKVESSFRVLKFETGGMTN